MLTLKLFVCTLFLATINFQFSVGKFRVIREWNHINFTWPNSTIYQQALTEEIYIPENNIIAGLKYYDGFFYVTHPRMKTGVPVTLSRIPAEITNDTAPLFMPYPSWNMNELNNCNALQNVQNVEIDPIRGEIWIIDGGRTDTLGSIPVIKCQPKLIVYNIKKNQSVFSYTFPEKIASSNGSFLYDIVLDNTENKPGYAYITDNSGRDPGIIVFSTKDHQAWKFRHSATMRADPQAAFFRVNEITISAPLNIASLALGPRIIKDMNDKIVINDDDRELYYAPLSSLHLYGIGTSVLKNREFASTDGEYQGNVTDYGTKASPSVGMLMDNQGNLYYTLLALNSVAKWDSNTPFQSGQKIIAKDKRYLEWVNSFALDDMGNLTVLVNRLNQFIYGGLNLTEPNFRLISSNVGGKNYLYDESYNYENTGDISSSSLPASTTVITTTTEKMVEPRIKPGMDQDPYLAPAPEPKPEPEPETNSSTLQTPSISSASASSKSAETSTTTSKPSSSSSSTSSSSTERAVFGFISLLLAVMLFVV